MNEIIYFDVKGMHCPNCPAKIERSISKLNGVTEVKINSGTENGYVTFNNNLTSIADIFNRINKMGFEAKRLQSKTQTQSYT